MTNKRNTRRPIVYGRRLPPQDLGRICKLQEYKGELVADYVEPGCFMVHSTMAAIESALAMYARGKGKSKGGKPGKPKLPDPHYILGEVDRMQGDKPVAGYEGNIVYGTLNGEFADGKKVPYFGDTFDHVTRPFHVLHLQEFSKAGCRELEKLTGYHVICSAENSRGQAVGIAFHPRCVMIGDPIEINEFKDVEDGKIPDLRPALRQDWYDSVDFKRTGKKRRIISICVHPKSMLGGAKTTGAIRYQQFQALMDALKDEIRKIRQGDPDAAWGIIVAGDFNFMAYKGYQEVKPLKNNGFKMLDPDDRRSTNIYSKESRIDYIYSLGFDDVSVACYDVLQFFNDIGRLFTDHARPEGQILAESTENTSPSHYTYNNIRFPTD